MDSSLVEFGSLMILMTIIITKIIYILTETKNEKLIQQKTETKKRNMKKHAKINLRK